jgi:peptidoglycan/xylan/chitin deacetylase (PgdA/CDA1 family)
MLVTGAAVFVYHDLVEDAGALAAVSPAHRPYVLTRAQLAAHLAALAAPGLRASGLAETLAAPAAGRFVLTFDDGHVSNYRVAFPMLAERGWPGCFFVIASQVGSARTLGWRELREMADAGMEIGSHSLTHPFMHRLSAAEIRHEFAVSKRILEDGLGRPVVLASLPRGSATPTTGAIVAALGYRVFCTSEPGLVTAVTDPFAVPRIAVKRSTPPAFLTNVLAGRRLTLARIRSSHAVKTVGKWAIGAETWRRVRGALVGASERRRP